MTSFILLMFMAGAAGLTPLNVDRFDSQAECEAELARTVKQIPMDAQISYVAVCAPVRNATEAAL